MEHKTWLWRRKTSEKSSAINDKFSLKGNEEEAEKAEELERSLRSLQEKLTSALTESNAKDDLLAKHVKVGEEALAGWEKAEEKAASFKQELDDALKCKIAAEERISNLDAALKECMQQSQTVREEKKQMASHAAEKTLREKEKTRVMEEQLEDLNKRFAKLGSDNSTLIKVLEFKEKMIEELMDHKTRAEENINEIMARLDSSEKSNASLKYEVCMLEKELQIRNEEKEFNLKSVDAAHRQQLESRKKITKLEAECQRLRIMVRKRLPGPAALEKMKSEVKMLGRDANEMMRKKSYTEGLVGNYVPENYHDSSTRRDSLAEILSAMVEENRNLKEALTKKNSELQSSRVMCACTASKLFEAETKLEKLSKGQTGFELACRSPISCDMPLASISQDGANEDNISCAESWASALISELEHFRNGKLTRQSSKTYGFPDPSLMDDFVEMERLSILSMNKPFGNSLSLSGENSTCLAFSETESRPDMSEATGKELVLFSSNGNSNPEIQSSSLSFEKSPSWLKDIVRVILEKHHITQRSLDDILEEVKVALAKMGHSVRGNPLNALHNNNNGNISQKPQHISSGSFDGAYRSSMFLTETRTTCSQSNLDKSIGKLVELVEGIYKRTSTDYSTQATLSGNDERTVSHKGSSTLNGYMSHVFQWKSSELRAVLRHFIQISNDMLHQKTHFESFVEELVSTLDWIINHCFSLQDVSSMKETIKKHLDWDESRSETELDTGLTSPHREAKHFNVLKECKHRMETTLCLSTTANSHYNVSQREEIESKHKDERLPKDEMVNMEAPKNDSEESLKSATTQNESLITQLNGSEQTISSLQVEIQTLKESKGSLEDQIENQKILKEDLDTQLSVAKVELNEAHQKFSSLEVKLEDKTNCSEELEATCPELQLQSESVSTKGTPNYDIDQDQKQLRRNWEISSASEKLAECQETILNLGKQLKALASPRNGVLFDKAMSAPVTSETNHRPALLDQMLAEDDQKFEELKSAKTKEIMCTNPQKVQVIPSENPNAGLVYGHSILPSHDAKNPITSSIQASPIKPPGNFYGSEESNKQNSQADAGVLAIVPKRRKGSLSLLRKLLLRKRKESNKKLTLYSVS